MNSSSRITAVLLGVAAMFLVLALAFATHYHGPPKRAELPLVDPSLIQPTSFRTSYVQLVRMKADLSDFDCYGCHEKGKPPTLRFDTNQNIVVPQEHADVVMHHGEHGRNNNCFNCHDEHNLLVLQTRDGHEVKFDESPRLCGSCHGPTYRDWQAGAHGRTYGEWNTESPGLQRLICADCHNPHSPKIPTRKPLPPPHPLRAKMEAAPPH